MIGKLAEEAARWDGGQFCGWELRLGEGKSEEGFGVSTLSVFVCGPQHKMCFREVLHRPHKQSPQSSSETICSVKTHIEIQLQQIYRHTGGLRLVLIHKMITVKQMWGGVLMKVYWLIYLKSESSFLHILYFIIQTRAFQLCWQPDSYFAGIYVKLKHGSATLISLNGKRNAISNVNQTLNWLHKYLLFKLNT